MAVNDGLDGIRQQLYLRRKDKGLTQKEVADKLGIVQQRVSLIENGPTPGFNLLQRYAQAIGVKITVVIEDG